MGQPTGFEGEEQGCGSGKAVEGADPASPSAGQVIGQMVLGVETGAGAHVGEAIGDPGSGAEAGGGDGAAVARPLLSQAPYYPRCQCPCCV